MEVLNATDLQQRLKRVGILPTLQRMAVASVLPNRPVHLTAEQVMEAARTRLPALSRAAAYAVLQLFVRRGLLKELPIDGAATGRSGRSAPCAPAGARRTRSDWRHAVGRGGRHRAGAWAADQQLGGAMHLNGVGAHCSPQDSAAVAPRFVQRRQEAGRYRTIDAPHGPCGMHWRAGSPRRRPFSVEQLARASRSRDR
jgi:hypothetical protein